MAFFESLTNIKGVTVAVTVALPLPTAII